MHYMGYIKFCLLKMFLESPNVLQVAACSIGQEYSLHMIQVYLVAGLLHHE